MKSFLRWAGSKLQLLPQIAQYWTGDANRYIEPFCGSASLFFFLQPPNAILSDLNGELIESLQQIQLSADSVAACIGRFHTSRAGYYKIRALNPSALTPNERAARFIYLNSLCFNGLYRVNRLGQFNVPLGTKHREVLLDPMLLRNAGTLLQAAQIEHSDFESIVDKASAGDFIYLDPPYATGSKRTFVEYGEKAFSEKDLKRLLAALRRANRRGASFVLSYADVPEIRDLPKRWNQKRVRARRNIAGFVASRRTVSEILVSNVRRAHG